MAELAIRMVASLAIVVGLLLLIARVTSRRFQGRQGSLVTVLHRQSLSRSSSVAVVSVGSRVLVLGTTEQQVAILAELEPGEIDVAEEQAAASTGRHADFASELGRSLESPATPLALPGRHTSVVAAVTAVEAIEAVDVVAAAQQVAAPVVLHPAGKHAAARGRRPAIEAVPDGSVLGGSVLSPQTWRQALRAVTGRAS